MDDILQIKLLGTALSIKAGDNKEYIRKVVSYYQKKLQETQERSPMQDPLKLSILTSFNIIDELFKAEGDRGQTASSCSTIEEELEDAARSLIEQIDRILEDNEEI
ncbi:MAG: cell division protein ZapA [Spirochaetales bacterium]|nr:cell division protein ZapA [Spirochaetales bacterium]